MKREYVVRVPLEFYNALVIDHAFADQVRAKMEKEADDDDRSIFVQEVEVPKWERSFSPAQCAEAENGLDRSDW